MSKVIKYTVRSFVHEPFLLVFMPRLKWKVYIVRGTPTEIQIVYFIGESSMICPADY